MRIFRLTKPKNSKQGEKKIDIHIKMYHCKLHKTKKKEEGHLQQLGGRKNDRATIKGEIVKFIKGKYKNQKKMEIYFSVFMENKNYHRILSPSK